MDDLRRLVERTRQTPLTDEEYTTLKAAIETLGYVADLLEQKGTTVANLRQLLFGATTEKTRDVLAQASVIDPTSPAEPSDADPTSDADHWHSRLLRADHSLDSTQQTGQQRASFRGW